MIKILRNENARIEDGRRMVKNQEIGNREIG